jgi:hypothetical protein
MDKMMAALPFYSKLCSEICSIWACLDPFWQSNCQEPFDNPAAFY